MKNLIATLFFLFAVNASALTLEQLAFKIAYKEALKGDDKIVATFKKSNPSYRLNHYLDYALLKADMKNLPETAIEDFIKQNKKSPLNDLLNNMLTYELGKQGKWQKYLVRYKNNKGSQTKHCWYLNARIKTADTKGLPQAIQDFWMNGLSLPDACNPVFNWWEKQGYLNDKLLIKRFKLAYKVNNASTARYLASKMKKQPSWIKHALLLMKQPVKTLKKSLRWQDNKIHRELVYIRSKALSTKQPETMYSQWNALKKHYAFSAKEKATVDKNIALFAATDYLPFTIKAMKDLPPAQHDAQINAWKVRYFLYKGRWKSVYKAIKAMPAFQQNKDRWQYWLGRASAKTNRQTKAKAIFVKLAKKSNYYGFLAADHMRLPYQFCSQDIAASPITKMPENLENAFELFAVDRIALARKEWIIGYRELNTAQRRALADIAYQKGWYNKVTAIMGALNLWRNYQMRYPLAYKKEITQLANKHQLQPQWIMSIITQESAWQTDAISRADARGLMQLIDPTAKRLSKKLGLKYTGKQQLHQAYFNLQLGTFYQRELFDRFGEHPLLALSSYNAGETKANHWLHDFPTSPDIWAETIPYRETRDYMVKILTNVTIYDWLINKTPKRISYWLPTLPVDGKPIKAWPNKKVSTQTTTVRCSQ